MKEIWMLGTFSHNGEKDYPVLRRLRQISKGVYRTTSWVFNNRRTLIEDPHMSQERINMWIETVKGKEISRERGIFFSLLH